MTRKEAEKTNVFIINEENEIEEVNLLDFIFESIDETTTPKGVAPRDFVEIAFDIQEIIEEKKEELEEKKEEYLEQVGEYYEDKEDAIKNAIDDIDYERFFVEDLIGHYSILELKKLDIENIYTISTWGVTGNNYSKGGLFYSSKDAVDEAFFQMVYWSFQNDDQRITYYSLSINDALENWAERNGVSFEIAEFLNDNKLINNDVFDFIDSDNDFETIISIVHHLKCVKQIEELKHKQFLQELDAKEEEYNRQAIFYSTFIKKIEGEKYKETAKRLSAALKEKISSKVFHRAIKLIRKK